MRKKKVCIPVSSYGFDPTEVAIPWKILSENGIEVVFLTPQGKKAQADSIVLTGKKLGLWKPVLRARKDAVLAYREMEKSPAFCAPMPYEAAQERAFDSLFLPGGHDQGVKEFLESEVLQSLVADFFVADKVVAAICHGVVLAARSQHPATGKSVLHSYKTTCLLQAQEMAAYRLTRRRLGNYYLTYPGQTVEAEVKSALADSANFEKGPKPIFRDSMAHLNRGFALRDRNYLSARWPGDVYHFTLKLLEMITSPPTLISQADT